MSHFLRVTDDLGHIKGSLVLLLAPNVHVGDALWLKPLASMLGTEMTAQAVKSALEAAALNSNDPAVMTVSIEEWMNKITVPALERQS